LMFLQIQLHLDTQEESFYSPPVPHLFIGFNLQQE